MKTIPYLLYVLIDGHFRVRGALDVSHFSLGASSNLRKECASPVFVSRFTSSTVIRDPV